MLPVTSCRKSISDNQCSDKAATREEAEYIALRVRASALCL